MGNWLDPQLDVGKIFLPEVPLLEIVLRGTLTYLALCVLMRVVPKRQAGELSPNDMLLVVIVGGVAVAAIAKEYMALPDVLILIATILGWNFALDWLAYRFPKLRPILREPPTLLVQQGQFVEDGLRQEMVTEEDVAAQLRKQGLSDVADIDKAYLEADGSISVVENDSSPQADEKASKENDQQGEGPAEAAPPSPDDEVSRFLEAAACLESRVAWHQQEIASHQAGIDQIRALLAEHGVKPPARRRKPATPQEETDSPLTPERRSAC